MLSSSISKLITLNSDKSRVLADALKVIKNFPSEFDEKCSINLEWIGHSIKSSLINFSAELDNKKIDEYIDNMYADFYRIILEFDVSNSFDLNRSLTYFLDFTRQEIKLFSETSQRQIEYASKWMHINITKKVLSTPEVALFLDASKRYQEINEKIDSWDLLLQQREEKTRNLGNTLSNYENAFNFVGLYKGFDDFHKTKNTELFWNRLTMIFFGVLAILPIIIKLMHSAENSSLAGTGLLLMYIPYAAWSILMLYFFRISHRSLENIKSQILQIEIRKSLCQFIQSYSDFSSEANKKSPDTLKKFEAIIFSNVVGSSDKIPSTFDGIESLTNLLKSTRNN